MLCQPAVIERFSIRQFEPGTISELFEFHNDGAREQALLLKAAEDGLDVGDKDGYRIHAVNWRTQSDSGLAGEFGPVAAGDVGKDEERFPRFRRRGRRVRLGQRVRLVRFGCGVRK